MARAIFASLARLGGDALSPVSYLLILSSFPVSPQLLGERWAAHIGPLRWQKAF
jgi:hypothetical protein